MILTRQEVAAKYESAFDVDRYLHVPCKYAGPLSNITLEAADEIYNQGSNLIILKVPQDKPAPELPDDDESDEEE